MLREEFPRPLLIGIIQHEVSPSRVIVNPPHTYLITDKDEAIVMAVDLRHAQEVMELDMIKKLAGKCLKKCSKCRDLSVLDTQPSPY